jgi:membrane peptidoglycan carboxypeptidase
VNSADGESSGYQDLIRGTAQSLNTIYTQLNFDVGTEKMAAAAHAAGVPDSANIAPKEVGNVLGSANPHPLDMASAYATFASGGIRRPPYVIQKISMLGSKQVIYDMGDPKKNLTKGKRVFKEDHVKDLTYALRQVVESNFGTGTYVRRLGRPVAGKTGTSSDSRSAWFVGYTPQLSTAVAMYQVEKIKKDGKVVFSNAKMEGFGRHSSIFGGGYPAEIWTEYMEAALKGQPVKDFPDPVYGGEIKHEAPVIKPTDEPTPDPNPTTTKIPIPDPTETQELPDPTETEPTPTRTRFPTEPTISPTPTDSSGGGGGGGGNDT